jgi:hypothetical protein
MKTARLFLLLALCSALFSTLLYLGWSYGHGSLGFPLDDAWIHQTYARNLVRYGQFAYVPGQPSAGSTAPLWTLLLSVGYFLQLDFKIWAYCLGFVFQTLTAWAAYRLASRLWPQQRRVALFAGLFCALEWHLVWAAFSGMETILFILFALLLMERYLAHASQISIGLLGGLLTVTRPEGLVLCGLIVLDALRRYLRSAPSTSRRGEPFDKLRTGLVEPSGPCIVSAGLEMPSTASGETTVDHSSAQTATSSSH